VDLMLRVGEVREDCSTDQPILSPQEPTLLRLERAERGRAAALSRGQMESPQPSVPLFLRRAAGVVVQETPREEQTEEMADVVVD
jgi:hypothetical protein